MKLIKVLFVFYFGCSLTILSCKNEEVVTRTIPWYISLSDSALVKLNVDNTYNELSKMKNVNKVDDSNLLCYLSDINYVRKNFTISRDLFNKSFKADSLAVVENYLLPIYKYLIKERPQRLTSIPPIIHHDFDHFVGLVYEHLQDEVNEPNKDKLYLNLTLARLNLYDQWFRVPNRNFNVMIQDTYDSFCQLILDKYFLDKNLVNFKERRDLFLVIILHAKNCIWVEKWIRKYVNDFREDKFLQSHLSAFMHRSECNKVITISDFVNSQLN